MIKTLEKAGRTEDDAINAALKELGLDRDDVSVEIVERAKSGFFGIGATQAVVRVTYECEDISEPVKEASLAPAKAPAAEKEPESVKAPAPEKKAAAVKEPEEKKAAEPQPVVASVQESENARYAEIRAFLTGLFDTAKRLTRMGAHVDARVVPDAQHSEAYWEQRIPVFMEYLLK